jgi:hypothetical protein
MALWFRNLVVAVLLSEARYFRRRESRIGVGAERGKRVGNRRGGDVSRHWPVVATLVRPCRSRASAP